MKQAADKYISDTGGLRPGRLAVPVLKTVAQRQCEYLQRRKFNFLNSVTRHEKS